MTLRTQAVSAHRTYLVAVAGNPNCGKTTLFNALTGLRHKVGNYAGVTVEKREGALLANPAIRLLDLPGTYSLSARSPDEMISRDVLLGRAGDTATPDAVLIVADATNLERNLFLASQVIELGLPAILACNMMDLVEQAGHWLDVEALSDGLGIPVVGTIGPRAEGVNEIRAAIESACSSDGQVVPGRRWALHESEEREVEALASAVSASGYAAPRAADGAAILLLSEGVLSERDHLPKSLLETAAGVYERMASRCEGDVSFEITAHRYAWLREVVDRCLKRAPASGRRTTTDRLDRILTHHVWGKVCFVVLMAGLFYSLFAVAGPLMVPIADAVSALQAWVTAVLPAGVGRDLLRNGIIAGVGAVLLFLPQICILFLLLALLEDSGYMARAAFLMNPLMSRTGLHGKSFIPLLSAHACAVPGILAARTIENPRDRLATILVAPFMSCSARLPVYTLLIGACLPAGPTAKAGAMVLLYVVGIVAALGVARVLKKTVLRGPAPGFIIELGPYRLPRPKAVLLVVWDRCRLFVTRAGTVILAMTVVLWALMSFPGGAGDIRHSYAGRLGRMIEPAIRPLGFNWEIGVGLIASFTARELFVSTMGVVYSVSDSNAASVSLPDQIRAAKWPDGSPLFTPLVAIGLLAFYVLSCQCLSTIAVVRMETHSWRWPIFMVSYMTLLAYTAALIIHQAGTALGWG